MCYKMMIEVKILYNFICNKFNKEEMSTNKISKMYDIKRITTKLIEE